MTCLIVPAIITSTQAKLDVMLQRVWGKVERVQLDIMDGDYVPNVSLNFDFKLLSGFEYEAHLMINNPFEWIRKNGQKVQTVIMHVETLNNTSLVLDDIKKMGIRVGLASTIETKLETIIPHLKQLDQLLMMTVDPGSYCVKKEFRPEPLLNIRKIREIDKKIPIEVDGCMDPENARLAKESGANIFASGSYIFKSDNVDAALKELKDAVCSDNN